MSLEMIFDEKPDEKDLKILWQGIDQSMVEGAGEYQRTYLCFLIKGEQGEVLAGIQGNYEYHWLWVDTLWVSDKLRGQGYGIKLLKKIEQEAIARGCKYSHLSSFSFQAADFYKKQGYTVFGEIEEYPGEHSRCWLRKNLV